MKTYLTLALALGLGVVAGCGGNGSSNTGNDSSVSGDSAAPTDGSNNPDAVSRALALSTTETLVRVTQGSSVFVPLTLTRADVDGAVTIEAEGLPTSVGASALSLGAGQSSGQLEITALGTAAHGGPFAITLRATAVDHPGVTSETEITLYVAGSPGAPDTSFSFDGLMTYRVTDPDVEFDAPRKLALDSAGRIVVCGVGQGSQPWVGWLVRFLPDGSPDPGFGDGGEIIGFGLPESSATELVTMDDDSIVVLARVSDDSIPSSISYLRRFAADGTVDSSFGTGGDTQFPTGVGGRKIQRTPSGLLVMHDYINAPILGRFSETGTPDPSFTFPPAPPTGIYRMAVDTSDRILTGSSGNAPPLQIVRYLPGGEVDSSFGTAGTLELPVPTGHTSNWVMSVVVRDDGSGAALAQTNYGNYYENEVKLYRFTASGELDGGFGSGGAVLIGGHGNGVSTRFLADGSLLVLASDYDGSSGGFVLQRLLPDGAPDTNFGSAGRLDAERGSSFILDPTAGRALLLGYPNTGDGGVWIKRIWL